MGVGGENAVSLVEGHVQRVVEAWCGGGEGEGEEGQRWPSGPTEEGAWVGAEGGDV